MIKSLEILLEPVVTSQGVELYDIEYVKEGLEYILRLFIDKVDGVDLDDCERVSHAVSDTLDLHDPIVGAYRLQVGSPGIERKLTKSVHYQRFIGRKIMIKLYAPHNPTDGGAESITTGRKKFTGELIDFYDDKIKFKDIDDEMWIFSLKEVASCKLVVFEQNRA